MPNMDQQLRRSIAHKNKNCCELVRYSDPEELQEWIEAFESVARFSGTDRCEQLLRQLLLHASQRGVNIGADLNSPYCNTIARSNQLPYPGNLELEGRITSLVRWNALAMVIRANKDSSELGGHLASYASTAELFEVGFNHFFHGDSALPGSPRTADLIFFQPHSAPGVYARAFLEGRLSEQQLSNYRREVCGRGLSSYPHPWLMPEFWQFPTGSMGLGVIAAIYQARFMRYLEHRALIDGCSRRVWAFVGDGEMDEPESLAGLSLASRENLDNLTFVINCNLQRLDGPVRGNGSIIQELERVFKGCGWNVIKVLWGSDWDQLFERDRYNLILTRLHETVDGELQAYGANDGRFNREKFFNRYPELEQLTESLSDSEINNLTRGGHDPVKIHAAFDAAVGHRNQPTVILAQTKKGYGLGRWAESRMSAHQQKKLDKEALYYFRERFRLELSDDDVENANFVRPSAGSPELQYLIQRREALGGYVPKRLVNGFSLETPPASTFAQFAFEQESREMSTTVALVRMLTNLLKDKTLGRRIVPIVADEARTFGMQSLFRQFGIYSHCGQLYEPEDSGDFLFYKESSKGQILEEGITEAGALSSWIAAATAYSHHGQPMLPFYLFYSIFGFQRVGDMIWSAADSRSRGFLVGATAGRTTLSGEGLQHQDGNSHLIASTIPNCRAYDPCFAYEIAIILQHGLAEMLETQADVFYYLTVMNENYLQPAIPPGADGGIVRGMYKLRNIGLADADSRCRVQLLGSGTILREVTAAAELLERDWNIGADVWSVTSFTELRREGIEAEEWSRFHPTHPPRQSWLEECLSATTGPVIAATDYVRAVADLIRTWVPRRYVTLGTDGFGLSDTRAALRRFFGVDRISIIIAAAAALADEGAIDRAIVSEIMTRYDYIPNPLPAWADRGRTSGPRKGGAPSAASA